MSCGCQKNPNSPEIKTESLVVADTWEYRRPTKTRPMNQCIFCAQKHTDEALVAMGEYTYELENRSFVHGSIRAVVNHTFKSWPAIATKAREAALLWQSAEFAKARGILLEVAAAIDAEIRRQNPDIDARIRQVGGEG
jgi:hypothetical protein